MQQLLFETKVSNEEVVRRLEELDEKLKRNTRSYHAKNGGIAKEVSELKHEFEMLKIAICKMSKNDP